MNVGDIIKLSLGGYDTQALKELREIAKGSPEVVDLAKTGKKLPEIKELLSMADSDENTGKSAGQDAGESDQNTDYKKLYEEQKTKIEELTATVSKIQHDNAGKDISSPKEEKDPFDMIAGILGI